MVSITSYRKRWEALKSERSTFIPLYRELSDYHLAHRGRFLVTDRNKGHKRNTKQINNTSRLAVRTLASGMMSGITSPARPWFMLSSGDTDLDEMAEVKTWLHDVQTLMYRVFSQSNVYNSLHTLYAELGVFGTAAMAINKDFEKIIHCKPFTVGSYCLATNGKGEVDTFAREYEMTVAQLIGEFGKENCSESVNQMWASGNTETAVVVIHFVEPNDDRDGNSPLAKDKRFRSVYFENGNASGTQATAVSLDKTSKYLLETGFDEFPLVAPRWDVTCEDVYATDCPAITCLGDVKALQLAEKRKYQAIDVLVAPPLQAGSNVRNALQGNAAPKSGDILYVDNIENGITSIYGSGYNPRIDVIKTEISDVENRISRSMYEDLFLMLANSDRKQITAREVAEKHEEKLLMLGPVLERLHTELLDPLIDRTFNILQEANVLPEPPDVLMDRDLEIEYVSVLAQAQRLVATGAMERLAAFTGELSAVWPETRHKINATQMVDDFGHALGVNPKLVRSDDETEALQAAEQEAAAQAQAQQQAVQMAESAKTASQASMEGDTVLSRGAERMGL